MTNHEAMVAGEWTTRVVVITGASAGVGRATVRAFARQGRDIGLLARGRDGLEAARRDVEELGGRALVLPTDVADPDQVEAAAAAVERAFGPIDVWVNNAMVSVFSPVKQMKPEEYRRVTEVTYLGYVYGTLAALRRMLPRDRGHHHPGRLGAGVPRHPAPVGLLRRQARDPGLLRLAPLRADPRQQPRPAHDGADAGAEHAAVRLGEEPAAAQGRSRCRRSSSPRSPPRRSSGRPTTTAASSIVGWPTVEAIVGNKIAPGWLDHYLARTRLRRPDDRRARGPRPAGQPLGARPGRPRGARAIRPPRPIVELAALGRHASRLARRGRRLPRRPRPRGLRGQPSPGARVPSPRADNMTPVPGESIVCRTSCRIRRFPLRSGRVVSGDRWRRWWSIGWKVGLVLLIAWGLLRPWYAYSRWKQSGQAGNRTAQWNGHLSSDEHSGPGGDRSRPAE